MSDLNRDNATHLLACVHAIGDGHKNNFPISSVMG